MPSVLGRRCPRLRRSECDPRLTLVVVGPASEPEGWVSVRAGVTVSSDGAKELADRYWDATWTGR